MLWRLRHNSELERESVQAINGWSIAGTSEGEFSSVTCSYAGKVVTPGKPLAGEGASNTPR
jgi:hypothetical protein